PFCLWLNSISRKIGMTRFSVAHGAVPSRNWPLTRRQMVSEGMVRQEVRSCRPVGPFARLPSSQQFGRAQKETKETKSLLDFSLGCLNLGCGHPMVSRLAVSGVGFHLLSDSLFSSFAS